LKVIINFTQNQQPTAKFDKYVHFLIRYKSVWCRESSSAFTCIDEINAGWPFLAGRPSSDLCSDRCCSTVCGKNS